MNALMNLIGTALGAVGLLACAVAGLARLAGSYHVANYEATSVFLAGTGLMVFACLVKLELLLRKND